MSSKGKASASSKQGTASSKVTSKPSTAHSGGNRINCQWDSIFKLALQAQSSDYLIYNWWSFFVGLFKSPTGRPVNSRKILRTCVCWRMSSMYQTLSRGVNDPVAPFNASTWPTLPIRLRSRASLKSRRKKVEVQLEVTNKSHHSWNSSMVSNKTQVCTF